jgi:hypothetical protein
MKTPGRSNSGTPNALLVSLLGTGSITTLDSAADLNVLFDFPFDEGWRRETGCGRFVRLRNAHKGAIYALVRDEGDDG